MLQEDDALRLARLAAEGPLSDLRALIESGVNANLTYNDTPPLWRAAARNKPQIVRYLVQQGADVDARNRNGTTALYIAAQRGLNRIVSFLLESGADPNIVSNWGSTSLSVAIDNNHGRVASGLIEAGAVLDVEKTASGQTILWTAAYQGNQEIVQLLIQQGVDVDQADSSGVTPLYAAVTNNHPDVVELLLASTADPDLQKDDGNTALHSASANCFHDSVELLLGLGASRELRNDNNLIPLDVTCLMEVEDSELRIGVEDLLSPLIGAARNDNLTAVEEWLAFGEDVDDQLRSGKSALMCAAINNNEEIIDILLNANADVSLTDQADWTALHFAAFNNSDGAVRSLGNLSDPNLLNADSNTPLMIAVGQRRPDLPTVEALLEIGSDPNFQAENGDTAFHKAARFGNAEVLVLLRDAEADWSTENNQGDRPIDVVGAELDEMSDEEILDLQSLMTESSGERIPSAVESGPSRNQLVDSEDENDDDDDDSFSAGETVAFLLVPAVALMVCIGAMILHFRTRDLRKGKVAQKPRGDVPIESIQRDPEAGKELRGIDHFARRTDRDIPLPVSSDQQPEVNVSFQSYGTGDHISLYLEPRRPEKDDFTTAERVGDWVGTSTAATHGAPSSARVLAGHEITAEDDEEEGEPVVAFTQPSVETTGVVDETPRMPSMKKSESTSVDQEFDEFYDAKEKLSGSVIMSSTQSEEFKDALEQQSSASLSSTKGSSGKEGYQSAPEEPQLGSTSSGQTYGTPESTLRAVEIAGQSADLTAGVPPPVQGDIQQPIPIPPVESFPVEGMTETVSSGSQRGSSEAAIQEVFGSESTIPAVVQSPPPGLTSFAVDTFSDTGSIPSRRQSRDEWSTTEQTVVSSPNISLEIQPPGNTGDVPRVQATTQATEQRQEIEPFVLSTFGSSVSTPSQRQSTESRGLSLERPAEMTEEASAEATGGEVTPHPVNVLLSSSSSIESSGPRSSSEPERFVGFHPTSNVKKP